MSDEAKAWCSERGTVIRLPLADVFVAEKQEVAEDAAALWESTNGKQLWASRTGWFKKPFACLLSPYDQTVWIDLDCEIRRPLEPLFSHADHPSGIAIANEMDNKREFNSGVIVFRKGIPLLESWKNRSLEANHLYAGDQDILTALIHEQSLTISVLDPIYNWSRCRGENSDAVIYHWHGPHGKAVIAHALLQSQIDF